jgi:transcriptional regulator with GAF, ATPase, and Fis domain
LETVTEAERKTESRIPIDLSNALRFSISVMGEKDAFTHLLPESGAVTIGRAAHCDVQVADAQMSREHARIVVGEAVEIVDLGSSNGTRVGGRELVRGEPMVLGPGDVVSLGTTLLVLHRSSAEVRRPAVDGPGRHAAEAALHELPSDGALARLRSIAERFAVGTIPVLVLGETGVGKDVMAGMIHRLSPRADRPYLCLNCAALPESLLESELFGYERGAFTGASSPKAGLLESARGGTVLLDEVGEMPLAAQSKLLRVLDRGDVLRLGATQPRSIDVRFIAATNRDLEREVARGRFREDLFFRLAAAAIVVPPLRERVSEIAPLARTFVRQACRDLSRARVPRILPEALAQLESHAWPGNIRELRNAIERAVLLAGEGDIGVPELAREKMTRKARSPSTSGERRSSEKMRAAKRRPSVPAPPADPAATTLAPRSRSTTPPLHVNARLTEALARDPEVARLLEALDACDWNQSKAAVALGVSRRTLVARLSAYGLTRKRGRA